MRKYIISSLLLGLPIGVWAQDVTKNDSTNVQLNETIVEGASVIRHNGFDTYFPSDAQRTHSSNALDLLSMVALPGIHVDQVQKSIISSTGASGVVVKINNVEATLEQLQSIHPYLVTKIEYSTMPGMKYGTGTGAVINIKTKRDDYGFAVGLNAMNAVSDNYNDDGVWAKVWNKKSEFGLQYNFKLNNIKKAYNKSNDTFHFADGTIKQYTKDGKFKGGNFRDDALLLSYNYTLENKRVFDVKASFDYNRFPDRYLNQHVTGAEDYTLRTNTQSDEKVYLLKTYYQEQLNAKSTLEANVGFAYLDNAYDRGFASPWSNYAYKVNGNKYATYAKLDFVHQLSSKSQLSFGYQQSYDYTRNKYVGTNNQAAKINDDTEYLYAEYALFLPRFYLSVGVGENRIRTAQMGNDNVFWSFRPQALLQYNLNKEWSLMYRYSRNATTPTLADLTEYNRQDDVLQWTVGNAALRPYNTDTHMLVADFQKKSTTLRIYALYEYAYNGIGQMILEDGGKFVHQNVNNVRNRHFESAVYWGQSFFNRALTFYVEPKWQYDDARGMNKHTNAQLSLQAGLNTFYKNWSLNGYYRTATEALSGDMLTHNCSTSDVNVGYRYRALQLKLGLRNAFRSKGKSGETRLMTDKLISNLSSGNRAFGNMVYISLSWSLMRGKMIKTAQAKDTPVNTDAGIVK